MKHGWFHMQGSNSARSTQKHGSQRTGSSNEGQPRQEGFLPGQLSVVLVLSALMWGCAQSHTIGPVPADGSGTAAGQSVKLNVYSDAPYTHSKVVCDPFADDDDTGGVPQYGLRGKLYHIPAGQTVYHRVDDYINKGVDTGMFVFLNEVFVPTRIFSRGFETMKGNLVQLSTGETLMEYFAMDFESTIGLSNQDPAGLYQLGILSDDGTVLSIKDYQSEQDPKNLPWQTLVDNDGTTPTRFACGKSALPLAALDRVPIRLKYYQGPRHHIALTLLWRRVAANTAQALADVECGKSGNDRFFNSRTVPSTPLKPFLDLQARGWRVLTPANYRLPDHVRPAPCTQNF